MARGAKTLYVYLLASYTTIMLTLGGGEDDVFVRTIYYYILCTDITGPYNYHTFM